MVYTDYGFNYQYSRFKTPDTSICPVESFSPGYFSIVHIHVKTTCDSYLYLLQNYFESGDRTFSLSWSLIRSRLFFSATSVHWALLR